LEVCVGAIDLWPTYILELLFVKDSAPPNTCRVAAFFYGHDVPLKVASRVYNLCNQHTASAHVIPFVMGGYYSTFYTRCNGRHMAQYYDCRQGKFLWVNGRNLSRLEPVLPSELVAPYLDCRPMRGGHVPSHIVQVVCTTLLELGTEEAFHIMDL
jgi:hypothetical protein